MTKIPYLGCEINKFTGLLRQSCKNHSKHKKKPSFLTVLMALQGNFDTIEVRVHFGAAGCIRVHFVLFFVVI